MLEHKYYSENDSIYINLKYLYQCKYVCLYLKFIYFTNVIV